MDQPEHTVSPHPVLAEYYPDAANRQARVDAMFDDCAGHYDWIDGMLSFGSGRWYRRWALRQHGVQKGSRLVDVGTGTGVIALIAQEEVGPEGEVVAVDPSEGMLAQARAAGVRRAMPGHGHDLPLPDAHFDFLTMGYALRHVEDLVATFREYLRVLRPGGKVLLLEITPPKNRIGAMILRVYMRSIVPRAVRLFRRSREGEELMRYFWATIENCVPPETILAALRDVGFEAAERRVTLGVFSEYTAVRPRE